MAGTEQELHKNEAKIESKTRKSLQNRAEIEEKSPKMMQNGTLDRLGAPFGPKAGPGAKQGGSRRPTPHPSGALYGPFFRPKWSKNR